MPNLHTLGPDTLAEEQAIDYDLLPVALLTQSGLTVPGSGMALANVAMTGYVQRGTALVYVSQAARTITLSGSAGTYWIALAHDTHSAAAGWTRVAGAHYLWQGPAGTPPANPSGGLVVASCVVTGTNITAVTPLTGIASPLMSQQHADAVAITDGRISLGGHAPTGVLDVQGSVQASDLVGRYIGVRMWPNAPSGATDVQGIRIEPATGAASGTANLVGVQIQNPPATSGLVYGHVSQVSAGTNRYNLYASGTAPNYFAGNVGIANATPSSPLDVTGDARLTGFVAFGANQSPFTAARIHMEFPKATRGALSFRPTDNDTGGAATVLFQNFAAATTVGSIAQTATATSFNTSSDARLKRNVTPLADALATLRQLRPVRFRWNADDSSGIGFLAHEAQAVIPESVTGLPDQVDAQGNIVPQGMDHSKLVPWLTAALQETLVQVEALTARVASLEEQLGL